VRWLAVTSTAGLTIPSNSVIRDVAEASNGSTYILGLREGRNPQDWGMLLMQADLNPDIQNEELGFDSYCISTTPENAIFYGGVSRCELTHTYLKIEFSEKAAAALNVPQLITFQLEVSEKQILLVRMGLQRVLTSGRFEERPSPLSLGLSDVS